MPSTPADSRFFGFVDFSENVDLVNFAVGFGLWEDLQSMENGRGLQMGFQIPSPVGPFSTIFMISLILLPFPIV